MSEQIFIYLALILSVAFVVSFIVRALRQPVVVGYIIAGIVISPFLIRFGFSTDIVSVFSELGIAFLLFMVGLHLNPKVIKEIGTASLFVGLGQMILTFVLGYAISNIVLGFDSMTSVYLGIAVSFSSTIIVMKLLSDKQQLDSLHGKISIGILIIQDLIAVVALMIISSFSGSLDIGNLALRSLFSGAGLIIILFIVGLLVVPRLMKSIAKSQELLFLFSITWAFFVAALFSYFGFSIEIGALIAGVILSTSPYSIEMSAKIRPLRDFFLIIFFIILGLNVQVTNLGIILVDAIILSLVALVFKPFILMLLMAIFGYTKRINFLVGISLAQISEFSLIILALGASIGHVSSDILATVTLAGIITIALSAYMTMYSQGFFEKVSGIVFERKSRKSDRKISKDYNAILFGYNRIGFSILGSLKAIKKKYLVVDFNPDTVADLNKLRIPALYGDAYDTDLLDDLPLSKIELAVSTIPDPETSILLIESIRAVNSKAIIIVRAHSIEEAMDFYKKGATYVLTPHFLGGEYVANMIRAIKTDEKSYELEKKKHIKMLYERYNRGDRHPEVEKN